MSAHGDAPAGLQKNDAEMRFGMNRRNEEGGDHIPMSSGFAGGIYSEVVEVLMYVHPLFADALSRYVGSPSDDEPGGLASRVGIDNCGCSGNLHDAATSCGEYVLHVLRARRCG